jgi:hypothetical protein
MAVISGASRGSGRPFMLRVMQLLTRCSMVISAPFRALYCGNSSNSPKIGTANTLVPALRWQLEQARLLPA